MLRTFDVLGIAPAVHQVLQRVGDHHRHGCGRARAARMGFLAQAGTAGENHNASINTALVFI
jgi:hypothetical protein